MNQINKVAFNTFITYSKAIFTALISLYSTRLILEALGSSDYGVFVVVGGMIAMLSFLNAAMTTSTQRFISVSLGENKLQKIKVIFANSVIIHLIISIIIFSIIEIIGRYLVVNQLNIASEKVGVALDILHFLSVSMMVTIISVPYNAIINAHENLSIIAVIDILNSLFKLIIAINLFFFETDRLFFYGFLISVVSVLLILSKCIYAIKKYNETNVNVFKLYNKKELVKLTSFAGWSLFGSLCALGRNQGVSIVLNLFYSTVVNAAYGIANQVNSQLMYFSQSLMSALRPQIMKSEGANDRDKMIKLSMTANKLSFYLFTFFALPFFFEMPKILKLWLVNVPEYSVEFCRSIILLTMMNQINMGLISAIQAIGKIKLYQLIAGSIQLLTLPLGYSLLKIGFSPYCIILVSFVLEIISTIFRVFYFNHLTGYSIKKYFIYIILNSFVCLFLSIVILLIIKKLFNHLNWVELFFIYVVVSVIYAGIIYVLGLTGEEKNSLKNILNNLIKKISKK